MEKRNETHDNRYRRGLMESLLRRRDPGGDLLFDQEEDGVETDEET